MKKYTVSEYSDLTGTPTRTVRNWIRDGKLATSKGVRNNREVILISIDENEKMAGHTASHDAKQIIEESAKNDSIANHGIMVEDAEIIKESTEYNLVSMENTTFEKLISEIGRLSDARANTDQETIKQYLDEINRLRAELRTLLDDNKQLVAENAMATAEINILKIRLEEKEKEISAMAGQLEKAKSFWGFLRKEI